MIKRWLSITTVVIILIAHSATAQTHKTASEAKLSHNLVTLNEQYTVHRIFRNSLSFNSDDPLVHIISDRVVIDAIAAGEVENLKADLISLGMQGAVVAGRIVSGQLPISSLIPAAR